VNGFSNHLMEGIPASAGHLAAALASARDGGMHGVEVCRDATGVLIGVRTTSGVPFGEIRERRNES
jgi:hypothetical protein